MSTILIVDDNQDNIITAAAVVKSNLDDPLVLEALSGEEALRVVDETPVDLILIDVNMPVMNGIELCSKLRSTVEAAHVPIILITAADTTPEKRAMGLNAGAEAFLSKPIDDIELVAQMTALLRLKKAEDKLRDKMLLLNDLVEEKTKSLSAANIALQREVDERARVEEELRKLSSRLVELREEERKRLAVELHDRIGQILTAQSINANLALENMEKEALDDAKERLRTVLELAESMTDEIRSITTNLHPAILDDSGLVPALSWYAKHFSEMMGVEAKLDARVEKLEAIPSKTSLTLFRIAQEAMNNAVKHAAPKRIILELSMRDDETLLMRIKDDGRGFDPFKSYELTETQTLGIIGMKERAYSMDADFEIDSSPEKGTTVTVAVKVKQSTSNSENNREKGE